LITKREEGAAQVNTNYFVLGIYFFSTWNQLFYTNLNDCASFVWNDFGLKVFKKVYNFSNVTSYSRVDGLLFNFFFDFWISCHRPLSPSDDHLSNESINDLSKFIFRIKKCLLTKTSFFYLFFKKIKFFYFKLFFLKNFYIFSNKNHFKKQHNIK